MRCRNIRSENARYLGGENRQKHKLMTDWIYIHSQLMLEATISDIKMQINPMHESLPRNISLNRKLS